MLFDNINPKGRFVKLFDDFNPLCLPPSPWKIVTSFMDALLVNVKKPINILTGLDYWLDNLMCQVPEVLMCFHDEGIVKK